MDLIKFCIMNIFRLLNHTDPDPNSPNLEAFPLLIHPISLNVFFSQTIQPQVPLVLKQIIQAKELLWGGGIYSICISKHFWISGKLRHKHYTCLYNYSCLYIIRKPARFTRSTNHLL